MIDLRSVNKGFSAFHGQTYNLDNAVVYNIIFFASVSHCSESGVFHR